MNSVNQKTPQGGRALKTQPPSSSTSLKTTTKSNSIAALAERFSQARIEKEDLEKLLKDVNERLDSIENNLVDLMESSDLTALKTSEGHHLSLRGACYPTVKDKDTFRSWVVENGFEDALTMHHSTLKALCKELLEEAKPLPDGVEAFMKSRITFRRGGK